MTSYNFTIHKCLCDHDNNRRVCTIYSTVIKKREKKYQQQRVKFPTSYRNWTSIKLAQYLKNVSKTENVKGQLKKSIYFLDTHLIEYADSFIVLKHIFSSCLHFVPNYRLDKIKPTKNIQTSDRYSPVYIEKTLW